MALLCLICTTYKLNCPSLKLWTSRVLRILCECCDRKSTISCAGTSAYESKKNTLSLLMYSADQCTPRSFDV